MEITDIDNNTEHETRESFSWDGAFLASDGFLATEELSNMIEGGELQKIEEIESMEAKLFQEIRSSTKKSTTNSSINSSPKKKDSKAKKEVIKTPPKMTSKTDTNKAESPLKTLPVIRTKVKVGSVNNTNTHVSRTSPASPVSPGSPGSVSSTFGVGQWSKVSGSAPRRASVINEKPSIINARRNNDQKATKRGVSLIPRTQSTMSLKTKPAPVNSHSPSPSSSTTQRLSESSSRGVKSSNVHQISKPALKNHPTKQPAKTAATTTNTGLKPNSPKATTPKKQASPKAKASSPENIFIISPEILDLQCKIKALKMEIDMHKKDRFNKMAGALRVEVT